MIIFKTLLFPSVLVFLRKEKTHHGCVGRCNKSVLSDAEILISPNRRAVCHGVGLIRLTLY